METIDRGGQTTGGIMHEAADVMARPEHTGLIYTHYIYWYHAPFNVEKVLPELEPADVLVLESPVHWTPRERHYFESWIQKQLNPIDGEEFFSFDVNERNAALISLMPPLLHEVAERFTGSGKSVYLVDANVEDHPEIAASVDARFDYIHDSNESIKPGVPSTSEGLVKTQRFALEQHAITTLKRDEIIKDQIDLIREQHPGREIAVVYGQGHTQLSYDAIRQGYGKRTFVQGKESDTGSDRVKLLFNVATEIVRLMQFGKPVSDELVLRSLMGSSLVAYLAHERGQDAALAEVNIDQWDLNTADLQPHSDKVARSATSEEVEKYAKLIDDLSWRRDGESQLVGFIGELAHRTVSI